MSTEPLEAIDLFTRQPTATSTVWQSNQLVIARYQATPMQQKLILYAIAMIDSAAVNFSRYRIHIAAYAEACNLRSKDLYRGLREAAEGLALSPLLIMGHQAEDGNTVDLLTHWFSEVEFGSGYIDVTFPKGLGKYLLQVRNEFLKFDLDIPLQFSGEYTIRLYQWLKRWKFANRKSVTIPELRFLLGLVILDGKGNVVKERLPAYGDLKKWALLPAVNEIDQSSDITMEWKEVKEPGTKRVASIVFTILDNPKYQAGVTSNPRLPGIKKAKPVAVDPETIKFLAEIQEKFGLSNAQVRCQVAKHPVEYIQAKAAIVLAKPQDNAARAFLAALRDNWQPSKRTKQSKGKESASTSLSKPPVDTKEAPELLGPLPSIKEQKEALFLQSLGPDHPRYKRSRAQVTQPVQTELSI